MANEPRGWVKMPCNCYAEWTGSEWIVAATAFTCDHKQGEHCDGAPPRGVMSDRPVDPREQDVALLREILAFSSFKGAPGSDGEAALARLVDALEAADAKLVEANDLRRVTRIACDAAEARVVLLEAQLAEIKNAWNELRPQLADAHHIGACPYCSMRVARLDTRLAAVSVADSGPACPTCEGRGEVAATPGQPGDGPMPCPTCGPEEKKP